MVSGVVWEHAGGDSRCIARVLRVDVMSCWLCSSRAWVFAVQKAGMRVIYDFRAAALQNMATQFDWLICVLPPAAAAWSGWLKL